MNKRIVYTIFIFFILTYPAFSKHQYSEKTYQNYWCSANNGKQEYILPDQTRIDCLTENYAIEFDFAKKWAESIGQSLHYANETGKQAGIVLIMENDWDNVYLKRVLNLGNKFNIKIWTIKPHDIK